MNRLPAAARASSFAVPVAPEVLPQLAPKPIEQRAVAPSCSPVHGPVPMAPDRDTPEYRRVFWVKQLMDGLTKAGHRVGLLGNDFCGVRPLAVAACRAMQQGSNWNQAREELVEAMRVMVDARCGTAEVYQSSTGTRSAFDAVLAEVDPLLGPEFLKLNRNA